MNSWDPVPGRNWLYLQYPLLFLPGYQCSFVSGQSCATSILAECGLSHWEEQHTHFLNEFVTSSPAAYTLLQFTGKRHWKHSGISCWDQVFSLNKPVGYQDTCWKVTCMLHNMKQPPLINVSELELQVFVNSSKTNCFIQLLENKYFQGHCSWPVDIFLVENAEFVKLLTVNYSLC